MYLGLIYFSFVLQSGETRLILDGRDRMAWINKKREVKEGVGSRWVSVGWGGGREI